jgi:glycolate oxidase iron-sulfur subunit
LSWHVGNRGQAQRLAAANVRAFPDDVDAIVTNAAGCGSGMQEYHLILKDTPHAEQADPFRRRVIDVSAFLEKMGDLRPVPDPGRSVRVAYHDACHLANAQGVRAEPRKLLRGIPQLELREIADPHLCCGSAGTYNIDQPEIAASLGAQKADNVIATGAETVVSGNIGCLTQLQAHLGQHGSPIKVRHTMQLLRDAYAGTL